MTCKDLKEYNQFCKKSQMFLKDVSEKVSGGEREERRERMQEREESGRRLEEEKNQNLSVSK